MEVRAIAIVLLLLLTLRVANSTCIKKQVTSCISLPSNPTCLGASLSSVSGFTHTSTVFANDSSTLDEVTEKLKLWSGLKAAPKCWEVIQPFLCSVYMPRCNNTDLAVERPSRELCLKMRTPCDIIRKISGWPFFLDCNQLDIFSANCTVCSLSYFKIALLAWLKFTFIDVMFQSQSWQTSNCNNNAWRFCSIITLLNVFNWTMTQHWLQYIKLP